MSIEVEEPFFEAYGVGLVCASVCSNLPVEEITRRLNAEHSTGISSRWEPSKDETFADGHPNPCPCNKDARRKHYLFNC